MRDLIVFGNTSFAQRVATYIDVECIDRVLAFTQEKAYISQSDINGRKVVPFEALRMHFDMSKVSIVIAIGYTRMNELRKKVYEMCISKGYKVASYISSNSSVYSSEIGEGTIILPGCLVGPNCRFGKVNFAESSCVLSHDDAIGDYNFLSSNVVLGGGAKIGSHCFIGLHSTIKNDISIDDYTFVGASANVLKSTICGGGVLIGNPARLLVDKSPFDLTI